MRMPPPFNGSLHGKETEHHDSSGDYPEHYGNFMMEDIGHHEQTAKEGFENGASENSSVTGDGNGAMMGWFSMSRKDGGPSFFQYNTHIPYPPFLYSSDIAIWCLVFSIPLISFIILLPSFRKKHFSSVLVVVLCILTGLGIICAYVSSSWFVGEAEVKMSVGPEGAPIKSLVGIWVGLWHANVTYITPKVYINHMVTWSDRTGLMGVHKTALVEGWPLALLSLTAEISGEGTAWRGILGDGIFYAGALASYPLIAAMYSWGIWVLTFAISPELTCQPLVITGSLMAISALTYIGWGLLYFPANILVGGTLIRLRLGWAWWLIGCMSIVLSMIGSVLLLYDYLYPGKLSAMFKVDFYSQTDYLSGAAEVLCGYESSSETYSQIYPLSLSYMWYGNKRTSSQALIDKNDKDTTTEDSVGTKSTSIDSIPDERSLTENKNPTLKHDIETEPDQLTVTKKNETETPSAAVVLDTSVHVFRKSVSLTTLRRRTTPDKTTSSSEPALTDTANFATIRRGKTMPRQLSVPTVVPQVSPRLSGVSHKKSLSRIHSKFRPKYSPRKPSMVSLISIPRLELEEIGENVTPL